MTRSTSPLPPGETRLPVHGRFQYQGPGGRGSRTRLMFYDRQKPETLFNVVPLGCPEPLRPLGIPLPTTGGRDARQLPNMTFAGWATEPQQVTSVEPPFIQRSLLIGRVPAWCLVEAPESPDE
ncbi:hypothetical protein DPEC_G00316700 [Dallia pectoralis]|uniref:Uncharacterized protein n=1 Tax=Dallia pectoralis TaxID=75939 RepID=A0ACC2FCS4_DALPE|nr:hypothetical protein DPEC_G00316700 [Dallia pectoralis]